MPYLVPDRFNDKVAVITGAGSGIGRATALRLAAEGAEVFVHDVNPDSLAESVSMITSAGGTAVSRVGDVSERSECFDAIAEAVEAFGRLDVLVNVAGIAGAFHFADMTEAQYRRMAAVNMDAPFFFCKLVSRVSLMFCIVLEMLYKGIYESPFSSLKSRPRIGLMLIERRFLDSIFSPRTKSSSMGHISPLTAIGLS